MPIQLSDNLVRQIRATWQAVAPDFLAAVEGSATNDEAIEVCTDADRLATFCGAKERLAQQELSKLIVEHGYVAVNAALCETIQLL